MYIYICTLLAASQLGIVRGVKSRSNNNVHKNSRLLQLLMKETSTK